jgi:hypothetical protein
MQSTLAQKLSNRRFALPIEAVALDVLRGFVKPALVEPEAHQIPLGENRGQPVRVRVVEHPAELVHRIVWAMHAPQPGLGDEHPGLAPHQACGKRLRGRRQRVDRGRIVRQRRIALDALKAGERLELALRALVEPGDSLAGVARPAAGRQGSDARAVVGQRSRERSAIFVENAEPKVCLRAGQGVYARRDCAIQRASRIGRSRRSCRERGVRFRQGASSSAVVGLSRRPRRQVRTHPESHTRKREASDRHRHAGEGRRWPSAHHDHCPPRARRMQKGRKRHRGGFGDAKPGPAALTCRAS